MACKCVFVVSADHEERIQIRRRIEASGHVVVSSPSAHDALATIAYFSTPALVMVGSSLVSMSPQKFIEQLRMVPEYKSIPISQIGKPEAPRTIGTCCLIDSTNLDSIINWLEREIVEQHWAM